MMPSGFFTFDNISDAEEVHQRCVLITGRCLKTSRPDGFVDIETRNKGDETTFPTQRWPMCQGYWRALVYLSPGRNYLFFKNAGEPGGCDAQGKLFVDYTPVPSAPPLHLAIMVAADSPLLIDCPPGKHGCISSTHSSLDAAIAKFRMTALMWQAQVAEDIRAAGLGRRSFRLEEEWDLDTLTQESVRQGQGAGDLGSVVKVHIVRTNLTVKELRNKDLAQQNPAGKKREELHSIFKAALRQHGAPFLGQAKPVVAGLILDSAYESRSDLILGHAALGAHDPDGLSLGIFGSHLTYAWPRFFEEIPGCLLDMTVPGDSVGNDNGECATMWEACTVGQGAFLHEVGHAFSRPHGKGIMSRGYSRDWAQAFLARTAKSLKTGVEGLGPVTPDSKHGCHWDLSDLVCFKNLPHFRIPTDGPVVPAEGPQVLFKDDMEQDVLKVTIFCEAGYARVLLDGKVQPNTSVEGPAKLVHFTFDYLESNYSRGKPLILELLCMNGKEASFDLWVLLNSRSWIKIPGSNIRLNKKSIGDPSTNDDSQPWAVMLAKRGPGNTLITANKIDIRVGCGLDGAVVYYRDGTSVPCGPRTSGYSGHNHGMGGHQARKLALPKGVEVTKIAVCHTGGATDAGLEGLRIWLDNGKAMGALNEKGHGDRTVSYLEPEPGHKIIGFYGNSNTWGMAREFGIVTAPRDKDLPASLYDMPELQHPPKGGPGRSSKRRKITPRDEDSGTEEVITEDEDGGYDDEDAFMST